MKTILVTGGAGYIGSHNVYLLAKKGYHVIILDNLTRGFRQCIEFLQQQFPGQIEYEQIDLLDLNALQEFFKRHEIDAVIHFAAYCSVNEASEFPEMYYTNNVMGSLNLITTMLENNVGDIIFSSSCATYGDSEYLPLDESHPNKPLNAYGNSKYITELMLKHHSRYNVLRYIILRYFNVCGAQEDGLIGDSKRPSFHLMQNAVKGALGLEKFEFTYPKVDTPDGSPIRDYVNVMDLASAHVMALEYLDKEHTSNIFNVGTGTGISVKEIVDKVEEITGKKIEGVTGKTRKGDADKVYASIDKIRMTIRWKPTHSIEDSVNSLIKWYTSHPHGWEY
jgi:UDP-glucose 4-epimerase